MIGYSIFKSSVILVFIYTPYTYFYALTPLSCIYLITAPTVVMLSNSSEGISTPYSSSKAITNSNKSKDSTSKSYLNLVSSVISTFSKFYCSWMISFTLSNIIFSFLFLRIVVSPLNFFFIIYFCNTLTLKYFETQSIYLQYIPLLSFCQHLLEKYFDSQTIFLPDIPYRIKPQFCEMQL